jgi:DNA-binding NtrC family response regulator
MDNLDRPESISMVPKPEAAMPEMHCGTTSLTEILRLVKRDVERQFILRSLEANHWNRKKAARELQISYRALLYKIRDTGIKPNAVQASDIAATEDRAA